MEGKNNKISYTWACLAIFFWASAFPGVKYALRFYSPSAIMLFRFAVATGLLLIIAAIKKIRLMPKKEDIPLFVLSGGIGIFAYMWLFNVGTDMVESGVSSFIIAGSPVFSLVLSIILLKEKVTSISIFGIGVSAVGLVLIAVSKLTGFELNFGVVILALAAFCTASYNMIQRRLLVKYQATAATLYAFIFGTIPMLLFLPQLLRELPNAPVGANLAIIYMGVFPGVLSYLAWNLAIFYSERVATVANFMYLTPFIASTMAYLFLGETLPPLALVGGVVIVLGLVIARRGEKRKEKREERKDKG